MCVNYVLLIIKIIALILNFTSINCQSMRDRRPTVHLQQGIIVGTKVYDEIGRVADIFFGIPYATPPINSLRFTPPQKHVGWNGTYQALEYGPPCPQLPLTDKANEDCLYLNIWAPENAVRFGPIPVVIFFEGIEFSKSNPIPISGQDLAMEGIVVVTVNYRLNIFGFLCLGIPEARGNLGLLDQYLAIVWIKNNINVFGGDQNKITLFGYSAGAASVTLHMLSPRTAGLFQRVIVSSGSAVSPWHVSKAPFTSSKKIVTLLGCFDKEPVVVLKCLQNKSTSDILNAYKEYVDSGNVELFIPIVDDFLPENERYVPVHPEKAIKEGPYLQIPILTGISNLVADSQHDQWMRLANQGFHQLQQYIELVKLPEVISRYNLDTENKGQVVEILKWRYITSSQGDVQLLLKQLKDLDFDAKIEAPHYLQLSYYLETPYVQPIYVYYLNDLGIVLNATDSTITADLLLLFGPLLLNHIGRRRFNLNELKLSKHIKQIWKNFIFGIPLSEKGDKWRRYVPNEYYIENVNINNDRLNNDTTRNLRISFWTQLLPKISQAKQIYSTTGRKFTSPDPAASYRHALYTLVGLIIALLILLSVCIILLKKRYKERDRHFHMGY